jgi:hypothetical protein
MQKENSHNYSPKTKEEVSSWLKAYAEGKK